MVQRGSEGSVNKVSAGFCQSQPKEVVSRCSFDTYQCCYASSLCGLGCGIVSQVMPSRTLRIPPSSSISARLVRDVTLHSGCFFFNQWCTLFYTTLLFCCCFVFNVTVAVCLSMVCVCLLCHVCFLILFSLPTLYTLSAVCAGQGLGAQVHLGLTVHTTVDCSCRGHFPGIPDVPCSRDRWGSTFALTCIH